MIRRHAPRTYLSKILSGPESLQKIRLLQRDYQADWPVEGASILNGLVQLDEAVILQEVGLKGAENIVPRKRQLPGSIALWAHTDGTAIVRAGTSRERRKGIEVVPGDVVQITGSGRRSVENPSDSVEAGGLLVSVVPIEAKLGHELTEQDASQALSVLLDQKPDLSPQAALFLDGLDRGTVTPGTVYGYAMRHLEYPMGHDLAG